MRGDATSRAAKSARRCASRFPMNGEAAGSGNLQRPVVVAVVSVNVVQLAVDQVIRVVSVWHRLMAAAGPMTVVGAVAVREVGGAMSRVLLVHRDAVLVDVVAVRVVKTSVVEVVDVAVVLDCRVAATRAMLVVVAFVHPVRHGCSSGSVDIGVRLVVQESYGKRIRDRVAPPQSSRKRAQAGDA
jgi:hypothetical protein